MPNNSKKFVNSGLNKAISEINKSAQGMQKIIDSSPAFQMKKIMDSSPIAQLQKIIDANPASQLKALAKNLEGPKEISRIVNGGISGLKNSQFESLRDLNKQIEALGPPSIADNLVEIKPPEIDTSWHEEKLKRDLERELKRDEVADATLKSVEIQKATSKDIKLMAHHLIVLTRNMSYVGKVLQETLDHQKESDKKSNGQNREILTITKITAFVAMLSLGWMIIQALKPEQINPNQELIKVIKDLKENIPPKKIIWPNFDIRAGKNEKLYTPIKKDKN
ncbi:MAG: hypothetical protein DRQ88_12060 [Epsilonproteobacteria bacterium]|nr:MAG: hypothetical protein DRQ88_12060 [Campylobacterota bacterium]